MPLKLRLRPGERLAINGAVIRNAHARAIELEILNHAQLLRERDVMLPEEAEGPLDTLYLVAQIIHLDPGHESARSQFNDLAGRIAAEARMRGDRTLSDLIHAVIRDLAVDDTLGALKRLQGAIGRPGEKRGVA